MRRKETNHSNGTDGNPELKIRHFVFCGVMIAALLALVSHNAGDVDVIYGGVKDAPLNWVGILGATFSWYLLLWCGLGAYALVILFLLRSFRLVFPDASGSGIFLFGTFLVTSGVVLLLGLSPEYFAAITDKLNIGRAEVPALALSGGLLGQFFASPGAGELKPGILTGFIGPVGTLMLGWALVIAGGVSLYVADWHSFLCRHVFGPGATAAEEATHSLQEWLEKRREAEEDDDEEFDEEEQELFSSEENEQEQEEFVEPEPERRTRLSELFRAVEEEAAADGVVEESDDEDDDFGLPSAAARRDGVQKPEVSIETPEVGTTVVKAGEKLRGTAGDYVLPPISMLAQGADVIGESRDAIERAKEMLQYTLESFQIPGKVSGYVSGPRVTRFEITLEPGVNVKKVENLADNIAMNMEAESVRILAPIPGRSVVGVEVSNSKPEAVFMRSVLESGRWGSGKCEIPIALGKDVTGEPVVIDLAKAPHMLIAGATGTGKSVCTNSLIISLLFRFRPDELKLIMVDPKVVEFDSYSRLPHLLTPIINESSKVPIALRWAANEMDRRYHILAKAGVKKLSEFNSRHIPEEPVLDMDGNPLPEKMPLLVIIIDELADLMMTEAKKDVETNITRIAQKGRAAGIHIIVATQRPSTNVITGVIKANLPTRLCFQVRSMTDSRVVLDVNGAEKLLGTGDMLLMSSGSMNIERVQGAFVKDDDIKSIAKFVSDQAPQHFNDQVVVESDSGAADADLDDDYDAIDPEDQADIQPLIKKYMRPGDDDTMRRALEVVVLDRKASTSYLQRRLRIGYNRAAELIDQMEERGIVGPPSGSGNKRDILIFDIGE